MPEAETLEQPSQADATRRTNFDRLRAHLKAGSLASQLFDTWMAGEKSGASARMLTVLNAQAITSQETDAVAASPQD